MVAEAKAMAGREGKDGGGEGARIASLPFVVVEVATGIVSVLTGELSMRPLVGAGTAVDLAILVAGLAVATRRALGKAQGSD